jgi:hypothetical protein
LTRTPLRRRLIAATGIVALVTALGVLVGTPASAAPGHPTLVSTTPGNKTPNILDGEVDAILDTGTRVYVGGSFTQAQNHGDTATTFPRAYLLAFDKATGSIDTTFAPVLNNRVYSIIAGPAGTIYLGGQFTTINGTNRRKVAQLDGATGALVAAFKNTATNGTIFDLAVVQGHLVATGIFTLVGGLTRNGLASLNPTTGVVDAWLTSSLTGHHNYDGVSGANAGVGGTKLAVTPDGAALWVIGNFKQADGVTHDQIAKYDLAAAAATLSAWNTTSFAATCNKKAFDNWVRSIAMSPDGSYFVVVGTGGPYGNTVLCDSASRWETGSTGATVTPTWVDWAGGDTFLSVAISEQAVYVGGHFRWLNNSLGADNAKPGAVGRASIAALDPLSGTPLSWNPGRNPRGFGVTAMVVSSDGLWLGYDTDYLGNNQYLRQRIGFFPLAGGVAPASTAAAGLPGNVYLTGPPNTSVLYRVNAGGPKLGSTDGGPDWAADTTDPSTVRNTGSRTSSWGAVGTVHSSVPAGTPAALFSSERWDPNTPPEMQWTFPVAAGTHLSVRLYLANRSSATATVGKRKFSVAIDTTTVLSNYDIVADVGNNVGEMKAYDITSDGVVNINFSHGTAENPLIDGIEIVNLDASQDGADAVTTRSYDGASSVGAATTVADPTGTAWRNVRGAFWVGGQLFYGWSDGNLYRRTFNGADWGTPSLVNPYHDALWDTVSTGKSGQTFAGSTSNFYATITSNTGMFYAAGRLYYSRGGQDGLYYRWFNPDSGVVGADEFVVTGSTGFTDAWGSFVSGGQLYMVRRSTGELTVRSFTGGVPGATVTVVSGPGTDGVDWRSKATFVGP